MSKGRLCKCWWGKGRLQRHTCRKAQIAPPCWTPIMRSCTFAVMTASNITLLSRTRVEPILTVPAVLYGVDSDDSSSELRILLPSLFAKQRFFNVRVLQLIQ